ncbi:MAG TPA: hypothetical protein VHL57_02370 [Flavobacteriales bacterium]|jgi:hypothetical protein|nr:hypothetical protein [Flavobacteriales bacterium]
MQQQVDEFHGKCAEILDRYVHGIEMDMNRHAVKHGPMEEARAVHDMTKMLIRDVPHNMLAGLLALAILRLIGKKARGQG